MPKANKATFKSYVKGSRNANDGRPQEPSLLPGELVITIASQVLRFIPFGEQKQGLLGNLQVSNFKISFRSVEPTEDDTMPYIEQRNRLVGSDDIVLNNVDAVYQVSKGRRKLLVPGNGSTTFVKNLEIHCKDFQIHNFSLKATPKDEGKRLINAIVHHTMPLRHDLLFAFEYQGDAEPDDRIPQVSRFNSHWDWEAEISRLQAKGFKVLDINTRFQQSENLPESFVVPSSLSNTDISLALTNFTNYRCPTWSYSHHNGAALVRMPLLLPNSEMEDLEARMLQAVRTSHPAQKEPKVYSLQENLPSVRDIQVSYEKLKALCMPTSTKDLESTDVVWYSELFNTKWMHSVYSLLKMSLRFVDCISNEGLSVVIQEKDSRDLSPLVACLVQLLLDPQTRTVQGFQSLVEREWVAMGHRFKDRLGLVHGTESEKSPVFLLFLDCVWQLLQQFPSAFQFSEMYLTSIWDSACFGLFENFLFNCTRERENAKSDTRLTYGASSSSNKLLSVWDWSKQFSSEDISLFNNPLHKTRTELNLSINNGTPASAKDYCLKLSGLSIYDAAIKPLVLRPVVRFPLLKFWSHCYLRWLTPVQILSGGTPSEYLQQCILVEEILCLQHKIKSLESATPFSKAGRPKSRLIFESSEDATPPRWSNCVTSSFPYSPRRNPAQLSFFETPISVYLENSFVYDGLSMEDSCSLGPDETLS